MILSTTIRKRVLEHAPFHHSPRQIVAAEDGHIVRCAVISAENLGCALSQVEVEHEAPKPMSDDTLFAAAESLCRRVCYLLEPLRVVEADRRLHQVLVRSATPRTHGATVSYYELFADAKRHLTMRRVAYDRSRRQRAQVELVLTPDQLEILVEDLLATEGFATN